MKRMTYYLLPAIIVFALGACTAINNGGDEQGNIEDLLDVVWKLDSLQNSELNDIPIPDRYMDIRFLADMKIGIDAPCNSYEGEYELGPGSALSISLLDSSVVDCHAGEFLINFEDAVVSALGQVEKYALNHDRLTLYGPKGEVVLDFSISVIDNSLLNIFWILDSLETPTGAILPPTIVPGSKQHRVTLLVHDETFKHRWFGLNYSKWRLVGQSFCWLYWANYAFGDTGNVSIGFLLDVAVTGYCPYPDAHQAYFAALGAVDAYAIAEQRLILYDYDEPYTLRYTRRTSDGNLIHALGTRWKLDSLRTPTGTLVLDPDIRIELDLLLGLQVVVRGVCSRYYVGEFSNLESGVLEINIDFTGGSGACDDAPRFADADLLDALNLIRSYVYEPNTLTLRDSTGSHIVYFTDR